MLQERCDLHVNTLLHHRLENMKLKEEVGVDTVTDKRDWSEPDIKHSSWDRHSPSPRQWPHRPEEFEDEQRAKSVLENGAGAGHGRPDYCEALREEDHYPGSALHAPGGSPSPPPFASFGPPTPLHNFSPENMMHGGMEGGPPGPPGPNNPKKSSSRRNAWGNLSYADLITQVKPGLSLKVMSPVKLIFPIQAILSSPEKRLTLSQVYDWMVQNIPYFKDKGDSNSSAGWKVSLKLYLYCF